MAHLMKEFQAWMEKPEKESDRHHEQTRSTQMTFFNQVKALSNVIEDMGNPFIDESGDLVLDTRDLADPSVVNTCQTRDGNLDEFFAHENQVCQRSLSKYGQTATRNQIRHCELPRKACSHTNTNG